jgi:hypothetical protein
MFVRREPSAYGGPVRAGSTIRCQTCGSTTASSADFCRRCGNDLTSPGLIPTLTAKDDTAERTVVIDAYGPPDIAGTVRPRRSGRRRWVGGLVVLLGLALVGAGGYGSNRGFDVGRSTAEPAASSAPSTAAGPPPTATQAATATLPPTITATAGPGGSPGDQGSSGATGAPLVAAAPALTGRPETTEVVALLRAYFAAINARDFPAARRTLVARPGLPTSETEFRDQYRSTHDADVRLLNLAPDGAGGYLASVTFTSYQDPADAPDQTSSCLSWSMAYPLVRTGGELLIDVIGRSDVVYRDC